MSSFANPCVLVSASLAQRPALRAWILRQQTRLREVELGCDPWLADELSALGLNAVTPVDAAVDGRMLFAVLLGHPLEPSTPADAVIIAEASRHAAPVAATLATADRLVASRVDGGFGESLSPAAA